MMIEKFRNIKNIVFYAAWSLILFIRLLEFTNWVALEQFSIYWKIVPMVKLAVALICAAIIIANIFIERYTVQTAIISVLLLAVSLATAYFSKDRYMLWVMLLIVAAYKVNSRKLITITSIIYAVVLLVTVGTCYFGLNVDYIFDEYTRGRHSLGFGWTTLGPGLFFFFILMYIYLRKSRVRWFELLILEVINIYFYLMTDTRLTFLLGTIFLVFIFIESLFRNKWRIAGKIGFVWVALPIVICILALSMYLLYRPESDLWVKIDSMLSGRLMYGTAGINNYGYTPFGQPITWVGYYIIPSDLTYNFIDTAYLQILLQYGILTLAADIAIYTNVMYRAVKVKDFYLVVILAVILLHSTMEQSLMDFSFNILPVLTFCVLDPRPLEFRSSGSIEQQIGC